VWAIVCTTIIVFHYGCICAYVYLFDFYRFGPLVLVSYGDVIIFPRYNEKLMMQYLNILAHDVDLRDVGFWKGFW
jgi:hypothetical protein